MRTNTERPTAEQWAICLEWLRESDDQGTRAMRATVLDEIEQRDKRGGELEAEIGQMDERIASLVRRLEKPAAKWTNGELWHQLGMVEAELARRIGVLQGDLDAERKRREACEKKPEVERKLAVAEQELDRSREAAVDLKSRLTRTLSDLAGARARADAAEKELAGLRTKLKAGDLSVLAGASLAPAAGAEMKP